MHITSPDPLVTVRNLELSLGDVGVAIRNVDSLAIHFSTVFENIDDLDSLEALVAACSKRRKRDTDA